MTDRGKTPYGAWPSPITASAVAQGGSTLAFPSVIGEEVWWQESRPEEGGRTTVMHLAGDGTLTELLPAPWRVQTRVHEYGGRSFLPVPCSDGESGPRHGIVFAHFDDQRLYLLRPGETEPQPLTPEPRERGALRYADFSLTSDALGIVCVREHHDNGAVSRAIVHVPLSGSGAADPEAVQELVTGMDFFASPVPSPDGAHLAWIAWNHPRMPWDGTELRVGSFDEEGRVNDPRPLRGGITESVLSPQWRDASTLYFLSDWPGWWNLYEIGLQGPALALYPAEEEFTPPPWRLGTRPYCALSDGRLVTLHGHADLAVGLYDTTKLELRSVDTALTSWQTLDSDGTSVVGVAGAPDTPLSVVRLDPGSETVEILRRSLELSVDTSYLPTPRVTEFTGRYGGTVHANVYPPTHPEVSGSDPAPYVVWVHGGPTGVANTALQMERAYFTSRGIGIVDVNYGGSAGYGRAYRDRLHHQWGVSDVEDVVTVARSLIEQGMAAPERIAVRGGSAGGYTVLMSLLEDVFACGVSLFGVTDLTRLVQETHDFESRYPESLIGPLPGYEATYRERSPINRAAEITAPVLLLQGAKDPVVPPAQASEFAKTLANHGVAHAHIEFEDESHGFRKAESRIHALEAELAFYATVFGFEPPDVTPMVLSGGDTSGGAADTDGEGDAALADSVEPDGD